VVTLFAFFALAISVSFICSLSEAGLLSISRVEIARLVEEDRPAGRLMEQLKGKGDQSLSAILTLNTFANMVGAAGVGAAAGTLWGNSGVAAASGALTFAILVFGEIVPKSLGSRYAYGLARVIATAVRVMRLLCYPVVVVLGGISRLLGGDVDSRTSRADIAIFAKLGHADGAIREIESTTIEHILALTNTPLSTIMVPWQDVRRYPSDLTVDDLLRSDDPLEHGVFLACDPESGRPIGKVQRRSVYEHGRRGGLARTLGDLAEPVAWFPGDEGINGLGRERFVIVEGDGGEPGGIGTLSDGLRFLWGDLNRREA
jgi:CBS domain containing-hemolysin-like protein